MANEKDTNENEKLPTQTRIDPVLWAAVSNLAATEERSMSKTIEMLLKSHPRIQPMLESQSATA